MTRSRIFLFLLLAFTGGIAVRSFIAPSLFVFWFFFLLSSIAIVVGIIHHHKPYIIYGFICIAFFGGMLRFAYVEHTWPDLSSLYSRNLFIKGVVWDEPQHTENAQKLKIKVVQVKDVEIAAVFFILVTTKHYPRYILGDELSIHGILEKPVNYSEFDYIAHLAAEHIFSTISFPIIEKIGEGKGNKIRMLLSGVKHAFEANIDNATSEPHSAFLKGLLLGERESLPKELVDDFKTTGTSHIVALSGYNITLVGRALMEFLLLVTVPFYTAFWIAVSGIVLFVVAVGASPSVTRAGIMGILVLIAEREGRVYSIRNALALAAALMVFHNPMILQFDTAFQLSFLATLGLVYVSPHVERCFERVEDHFRRLCGFTLRSRSIISSSRFSSPEGQISRLKRILIETLSAQLMVLPLLIYLFGSISLISPLANVLVLVAVPYSMGVGLITGLTGFLSESLSRIPGTLNWLLLEYKIRVIHALAQLPAASIDVDSWVLIPIFVVYIFAIYKFVKK